MTEPLRAAGFVIYRRTTRGPAFLLLRAASHGTWGFPKGLIEPGESEAEAALRELFEETGLEPRARVPGFRYAVRYDVDAPEGRRDKTAVHFLAEVDAETPRLSGEHDAYAWLAPPQALERLPFENLRRVLAHALETLWNRNGPAFRPVPPAILLDRTQAGRLLRCLGSGQDAWVRHARKVAETAAKTGVLLRDAGFEVCPVFLHGAGLLHDAGRALEHRRHGMRGWRLLETLGLPRYARVSVTHWLKGRGAREMKEDGMTDASLIEELDGRRRFRPLSLEDVVVCVADALAAGDRLVSMDERFRLARKRYGDSPWIRRNESLSRAWLEDLERKIGQPLPDALEAGGGVRSGDA